MGFERKVPSTAGELKGYLTRIHESRKHVKSVKVNPSNSHLEIDLDWAANMAGHADMYLPLKRGKVEQAKELIERILRSSESGFPPSESDGEALFEMIDPAGK